MQETSHRFNTVADARAFAMAGNATLTLESLRTGVHFTYKVRAPKDSEDDIRFVSLLSGSDNDNDFQYLGLIGSDGKFRLTAKSRAGKDAPSVKAFSYFWSLTEMPAQLAVYRPNKCGRCGRALTTPESVLSGIGPECSEKMGVEVDLD